MAPQIAGFDRVDARNRWMTPEILPRIRAIVFGLSLFLGIVVWVYFSLGASPSANQVLVHKLRGLGVLTWIFALVQMIDMRFYNSRFARRRRAVLRIPESVYGWLFGQMLAWFGIVYYGFTDDVRWYVAGLALLL